MAHLDYRHGVHSGIVGIRSKEMKHWLLSGYLASSWGGGNNISSSTYVDVGGRQWNSKGEIGSRWKSRDAEYGMKDIVCPRVIGQGSEINPRPQNF